MNRRDIKKILLSSIIGIALVGIATYSAYEARNLFEGPQIDIESPRNGALSTSSEMYVIGTAKNISYIFLNDRKIFIDGTGAFREKLLLSYGYNIIQLRAVDKFNRAVKKTLEIMYK